MSNIDKAKEIAREIINNYASFAFESILKKEESDSGLFNQWAASPEGKALIDALDAPTQVQVGMKWVKAVKDFHVAMGVNYYEEPIEGLSLERHRLRCNILEEEVKELSVASINNNIVEVADGICDCIYILIGTAWEFGLANKLDAMFMEVHRSNMSKLHNGKAVKREDGKVIKSPNYSKPDLKSILDESPIPSGEQDGGKIDYGLNELKLIERYADNGAFSHYELIDLDTGKIVWPSPTT